MNKKKDKDGTNNYSFYTQDDEFENLSDIQINKNKENVSISLKYRYKCKREERIQNYDLNT